MFCIASKPISIMLSGIESKNTLWGALSGLQSNKAYIWSMQSDQKLIQILATESNHTDIVKSLILAACWLANVIENIREKKTSKMLENLNWIVISEFPMLNRYTNKNHTGEKVAHKISNWFMRTLFTACTLIHSLTPKWHIGKIVIYFIVWPSEKRKKQFIRSKLATICYFWGENCILYMKWAINKKNQPIKFQRNNII